MDYFGLSEPGKPRELNVGAALAAIARSPSRLKPLPQGVAPASASMHFTLSTQGRGGLKAMPNWLMSNIGLTLTVHVMSENSLGINVKARSLFRSVWNWLGATLVRPHAVETDEKPASLDFEKIYENNLFLGTESRSGKGSSLFQTRIIREEIPKLLDELKVEHVLDVPCGDWNWMRHVNLSGVRYTGGDIVRDIVDRNNSSFGKENRRFEYMDIISGPLPQADLILCRDCLVHLSFGDGLAALDRFRKSGAKWLLTTTFTDRDGNAELCEGLIWRPLNLEKPPYNLPKAERYINEGCTEDDGMFGDKCLGLWKLH